MSTDSLLELALEQNDRAAALAREAARSWCDRNAVSEETRETMLLLLSELATNSVVHSAAPRDTPIAVRADATPERLRVTVTDQGRGFDPEAIDTTTPHGGFGFYLLADGATRWGVERDGATTVWFEL